MKKKLLALALAFVLIVSLVPVSAFATESGDEASCDHVYSRRVADEYIVKPATCTEKAVYSEYCKLCGELGGDEYTVSNQKPLGHDEITIEGKAPTCTEAGAEDHTECKRCGIVLTEKVEIPATGHDYSRRVADEYIVKPATCTEKAVYSEYCKNCGELGGDEYTVSNQKPLGHDEITIEGKAPTCTEEGATDHDECKRCGIVLTEKEPIEALGHDVITIEGKAPTCTEEGATDHDECKRCGIVLTEKEPIPALGHTAGEAVKEKEVAPTCTVAGSYDLVVSCTVCKEELSRKTEVVAALGHTEEEVPAVAPTCEVAGLTAGKKCSVCDVVLAEQEVVAALGHAWDEGKITTPATATKDGVKTYTCKNDATHTKTEAVKYVAPAVDKDYDDVPKTGDNTAMILATMTGIALVSAMAFVFGKKRSAC